MRMNKIQLIGIDLDGTLLNRKKEVDAYTARILKRCIREGIQVYFVSGRPYPFVKQIARKVDPHIQIIAANGGYLEMNGYEEENVIEEHVLYEIIDKIAKYQSKAFFKSKQIIYTHESYDQRFMYDHMNSQLDEDLKAASICELSWNQLKARVKGILKILIYEEDCERLKALQQEIQDVCSVEIVNFCDINIDITAHNITKGYAMCSVMETYGITSQQVMAIGDSDNDLPMLEVAGVKVAMKNAQENIKEYCDFITDDNDHDGVGKAISKFLQWE